jgi:hypothetical protein
LRARSKKCCCIQLIAEGWRLSFLFVFLSEGKRRKRRERQRKRREIQREVEKKAKIRKGQIKSKRKGAEHKTHTTHLYVWAGGVLGARARIRNSQRRRDNWLNAQS